MLHSQDVLMKFLTKLEQKNPNKKFSLVTITLELYESYKDVDSFKKSVEDKGEITKNLKYLTFLTSNEIKCKKK